MQEGIFVKVGVFRHNGITMRFGVLPDCYIIGIFQPNETDLGRVGVK